jgi:serine/threonine-protein kinase PknG
VAYARVQESSSTYTESRVATIRCLIDGDVADLVKAGAILQEVDVDPAQRSLLKAELLARAIARVDGDEGGSRPEGRVAGCALDDRALRTGLEATYRELARHADDEDERVRLVDFANEVRPRTWT